MSGLRLQRELPNADTLFRLSRDLPDGLLFPKLEWLDWDIDGAGPALPFFRLFLSPSLRCLALYNGPDVYDLPRDQVAALAQFISVLPTSLESLDVEFFHGQEGPIKDALSSFVCRCGPSLRSFGTIGPLSDAATLHLMQLPNLSRLRTDQGPPQVTSTPVLQSLEQFHLWEERALPWLHFLASGGKGTLSKGSGSTTSHAPIRETLKVLDLPEGTTVDSAFLLSVVIFGNLVKLRVHGWFCADANDCSFRFTDDDMRDLAAALPNLKSLRLGTPCCLNTCKTTVASLISLSVHCPDLLLLETHFNVQTIVGDMQGLLDGGARHYKTKCQLRSILVGDMPLELDSTDLQTVAMGFTVIFPHMAYLTGYAFRWRELKRQMPGVSGNFVAAEAVVP